MCSRPARRAAAHVPNAVFANLARIFPSFDRRGTEILAVLELSVDVIIPSVRTKRIRTGPALRTCGAHVINRSWAALINVRRAPAATVGFGFIYVARTSHGWQPWYLWRPNASSQGELLPTT